MWRELSCDWFPPLLDARASAWAARSLIGFLLQAGCVRRWRRLGRMRALLGVAAGIGRSLDCRWWDSSELEWGQRSGQYRFGYTGYIIF